MTNFSKKMNTLTNSDSKSKISAFTTAAPKQLKKVSLDIYQNQVTALIGPNGCGKSTLIKSLNRIGELESSVKVEGRVEFFGQNIYDPRIKLKSTTPPNWYGLPKTKSFSHEHLRKYCLWYENSW